MEKKYGKIASEITEKLLRNGFIVHRYDAFSSDSVYIKMDYGVCYSIRISNHKGKKHLQYRYNVIEGGSVHEDAAHQRWYYNEDTVDMLIVRILDDREKKIKQYGEERYRSFIRQNKWKSETVQNGFWAGCREIRKEHGHGY